MLEGALPLPLKDRLDWGRAKAPGDLLTQVSTTSPLDFVQNDASLGTAEILKYAERDRELAYRDLAVGLAESRVALKISTVWNFKADRPRLPAVVVDGIKVDDADLDANAHDQSSVVYTVPSSLPQDALTTDKRLYERDFILYQALAKTSEDILCSRVAAALSAADEFTVDISFADTQLHKVTLYFVDWDTTTREQTVALMDGVTVLDSQAISAFNAGIYLIWLVRGSFKIKVTRSAGTSAALSGIFFDPSGLTGDTSGPTTASYVGLDNWTLGDWKGTYGTEGYFVAGDGEIELGSYVSSITPTDAESLVWYHDTLRTNALRKVSGNSPITTIPGLTASFSSVWSTADAAESDDEVHSSLPLDYNLFAVPDKNLADRDNIIAAYVAKIAQLLNHPLEYANRLTVQISYLDPANSTNRYSENYVLASETDSERVWIAEPALSNRVRLVYNKKLKTLKWTAENTNDVHVPQLVQSLSVNGIFANQVIEILPDNQDRADAEFWRQKATLIQYSGSSTTSEALLTTPGDYATGGLNTSTGHLVLTTADSYRVGLPFGVAAPMVFAVGTSVIGAITSVPTTVDAIKLQDTPGSAGMNQASTVDGGYISAAGNQVLILITATGGSLPRGLYLVNADNSTIWQDLTLPGGPPLVLETGTIVHVSAGTVYADRYFKLQADGSWLEVIGLEPTLDAGKYQVTTVLKPADEITIAGGSSTVVPTLDSDGGAILPTGSPTTISYRFKLPTGNWSLELFYTNYTGTAPSSFVTTVVWDGQTISGTPLPFSGTNGQIKSQVFNGLTTNDQSKILTITWDGASGSLDIKSLRLFTEISSEYRYQLAGSIVRGSVGSETEVAAATKVDFKGWVGRSSVVTFDLTIESGPGPVDDLTFLLVYLESQAAPIILDQLQLISSATVTPTPSSAGFDYWKLEMLRRTERSLNASYLRYLEGYLVRSGELNQGIDYVVTGGSITYGGATILAGATFTATDDPEFVPLSGSPLVTVSTATLPEFRVVDSSLGYVWTTSSYQQWISALELEDTRLVSAFRVSQPRDLGRPGLCPLGLEFILTSGQVQGHLGTLASSPVLECLQPWMIEMGFLAVNDSFWPNNDQTQIEVIGVPGAGNPDDPTVPGETFRLLTQTGDALITQTGVHLRHNN